MEKTKYIWKNGEFINWEDANIHMATHGLHYGTSVFEGIRLYETAEGPAVFRLDEHIERYLYSASGLSMELGFSKEDLIKAVKETCSKNELKSGYIRPISFYGYGRMELNPVGMEINSMIAVWPWDAYLAHGNLKVKTSKFMRLHPDTLVFDAKVSGHYVNSVLATIECQKAGYDEALLLDYEENVAEGAGENIFYVKNGKLYTTKLGNILAGITRDSVIKIGDKLGIEVIEKTIKLEELYEADEAFFTGTAVEIQPIASIDDNKIGDGKTEITDKIKGLFHDIASGRNKEFEKWLTRI